MRLRGIEPGCAEQTWRCTDQLASTESLYKILRRLVLNNLKENKPLQVSPEYGDGVGAVLRPGAPVMLRLDEATTTRRGTRERG